MSFLQMLLHCQLLYFHLLVWGNGNITGDCNKEIGTKDWSCWRNTYVLNKNINWENTALAHIMGSWILVWGTVYDNTISGTVGVGPLTIPAYVPNINVSPPLTGNWVTTMQYGISAEFKAVCRLIFLIQQGNTWQHFNSVSQMVEIQWMVLKHGHLIK